MKKTIALLLAFLSVWFLFAACGKNDDETNLDPNAVLTDSDVPLEVGAEFSDAGQIEITEEQV